MVWKKRYLYFLIISVICSIYLSLERETSDIAYFVSSVLKPLFRHGLASGCVRIMVSIFRRGRLLLIIKLIHKK